MKKENQKGFAFLEAIVIIAIVGLVLGIGYMWSQKESDKGGQIDAQIEIIDSDLAQETKSSATQEKTGQIKSKTTVDCEKDIDCFIEAQKNRQDAKVKFVSVANPFTATFMETKFYEKENEYIYYQMAISNEYSFEEFVKDFKEMASPKEVEKFNAMSDEVIKAQLDSMKKWGEQALSMREDTERSCVYGNTDGLVSVLKKWKTGSFSSKDWDFATVCVNRNLFKNPDCTLQSASVGPEESPSSLRLSKISISEGVASFDFSIVNFKGGESEVLWQVEDKTVATVSPSSGKKAKISSVNPGETKLIITDSAVNDCQISVPITVGE